MVEAATEVGPLLLPSWDRVITPIVKDEGLWELGLTRFLQATLRRGQTFVDVGAHVGYFTVLASKRVGDTGRVFAVEPEARNLELLWLNLERNACSNVVVVPHAASSAPGSATLELHADNSGAHRLASPDGPGPLVECVRLDDVIEPPLDIVKVDAQGYDHEVVDGLGQALAASGHAVVIVELSLTELATRGIAPATVLEGYIDRGFAISTLDYRGQLHRSSTAAVLSGCKAGRFPNDFSLVLDRSLEKSQDCPRRLEGLDVQETGDGLRVHNPSRDRVHWLNDTAAVVFDLCTGAHSVAEIVELVRGAYGLSDSPTREVEQCLTHLRVEGLII